MSENIVWVDESPLASVVNITSGNPFQGSVSPNTPGAGVSYDPLVHGASAFFDGVDDVLNVAYDSGIDLGTGDFTIEFWLKPKTLPSGINSIFGASAALSTTFSSYHSSGDVRFGASDYFISMGSASTTTFIHFAISRNSGLMRTYRAGVYSGNSRNDSRNVNVGSGGLFIGKRNSVDSSRYSGYIGALRIVKGTGLYPGGTTFTPSPVLSAVSGTVLLLNHYNIGIFDHTAKVDLNASATDTSRSSTQSKFGGTSIYCGGGGINSEIPSIDGVLANTFGTGDLTLETWIYHNTGSSGNHWRGIFHVSSYTTNGIQLGFIDDKIRFDANGTAGILLSGTLALNAWYHIALTRQSGVWRLFIDGVLVGSSSTQGSVNLNSTWFEIGGGSGNANRLGAWLDEIRFTRSIARYVSNFSVPTSAFPRA